MWLRTSTTSYGSFILDMDRSPGFGSTITDSLALLRLAFASAPHLKCLTLPVIVTRRTVLQKVRGRTYKVLPQLVNTGFQVLFHSPPGVLFTFPSQYYALSVTKEYLALRGGPRSFRQGFSCLNVLWILLCCSSFRVRGSHPLLPVFPVPFHYNLQSFCSPNPSMLARWFGLFRFRSPLLTESNFSFFSSGYLDVSVHRVPLHTLWIRVWIHGVCPCGFPHSDICGSNGYLLLPAAFRSLSRLSSALSAKASTLRSYCLTFSLHHSVGISLSCLTFRSEHFLCWKLKFSFLFLLLLPLFLYCFLVCFSSQSPVMPRMSCIINSFKRPANAFGTLFLIRFPF